MKHPLPGPLVRSDSMCWNMLGTYYCRLRSHFGAIFLGLTILSGIVKLKAK
jgi:hypothetical protein